MNYLGIDLGNKLCGISYTNNGIIFTLPAIKRVELINKLKSIIIEKEISTIVVGMPYDLYGKDKTQLDRTKKFIEKLKNIFNNLIIDTIDERFTTFESYNILEELSIKNKTSKKDSLSAYLILESYLNKKSNTIF